MRRAALLALAAISFPAAALAQGGRVVTANHQRLNLQCRAGGSLTVLGNRNTITARGCFHVTVPGNNNRLMLYVGDSGQLQVLGNGNSIRYVGARLRISNVGSRNDISGEPGARD